MAHLGLNDATQKIVDQEQSEIDDNIDQQAWSLPGKGTLGTPASLNPHWNGRNGTVQEQASSPENASTRRSDLPGFPRMNSLVNQQSFVPANDTLENEDPITHKKIQYMGPTLFGKPLDEISPEEQKEMLGLAEAILQELLGAPKATRPDRQGWNNTKLNSLARRRNHLNPDEPPAEMWRPIFKNSTKKGPFTPLPGHEQENQQETTQENMNMNNTGANMGNGRSSTLPGNSTPAWSMGRIGFPKQHVPEDFEQANPNYEDEIEDPIGSRRLQSQDHVQLKEGTPGKDSPRASKTGHWASIKPSQGSLNPSGTNGGDAFLKSRKKVLRNLIEAMVQEVLAEELAEQNPTIRPAKRKGFAGGTAAKETMSFDAFRELLRSAKKAEDFSPQEVSSVIDFVSSKPDLKQEFRAMDEKEIQKLEMVLDNNIANEKMAPFANKIEIARGDKHLAGQNQPATRQGAAPQRPQTKKTMSPGSGPAKPIALPKQPLSQAFTTHVQQRYNQIAGAPGLNKQQRERLLQQLGAIQFAPEGSEESKLRKIDDLVRTNVGTRVDFGADASAPRKAIPSMPATPPPPQQPAGFLGRAKSFLGLNETLTYLLEEEDDDGSENEALIVTEVCLADLLT